MAEILLSLTIIGVVAAITLPSLTGNINERTWNTQRKALYARFSQAIALMPDVNGYGTLTEGTDSSGSKVVTEDTVAETFVTEGLSKVLKINNICDAAHLADCGIVSTINTQTSAVSTPVDWSGLNSQMVSTQYGGWTSYSMINSKAAAFETQNGESIAVYYNPACRTSADLVTGYLVAPFVCANFLYDLNGNKGPNTVGKDIGFITVLYSADSNVVAPVPLIQTKAGYYEDAIKFCRSQDDARLPNKEEAISLWLNRKFYGGINYIFYTSSSPGAANRIIIIDAPNGGMMGSCNKTESNGVVAKCVKR